MDKPQIVLPADVYDTFELSCHAFGGIGGHFLSDDVNPLCLLGHAGFCAADNYQDYKEMVRPFLQGGTALYNDIAIDAMLGEEEARKSKRVSWRRYCKYRNIVRGE